MPNQPGPLEHREVLGDRRLGDARIVSQGVDGLFALAGQLFEDGAARGVGKSAEHGTGADRLHAQTITIRLWFVKKDFDFFQLRRLAKSTGVISTLG